MKNFVCVLLSCPFLLFIGCADLSERICLLPDGSEWFFAQGGISFKVKEDSLFWKNESFDFPLIRLAEVYLIYAEAACELGNGKISDEDLNFSINNTRRRAGIAPLTNALIANVWDAGYWDHEQNKTVCKKMNMLDEIRRERACELFGEGFREDDLKRWGIAHINLTGQKLGRHVYNTAYMTGIANNVSNYGEPVYQPDKYPLTYGVYEGSGPNDPDYGRSIANLEANLLYSQRDYLAPIPLGQIRLNKQLTQNPGW